jgi:tetratricopeptide (TPR) repeat protein
MPATEEALAICRRYRASGNVARAEELCRQFLKSQPTNPEALHLLGVVCQEQGKLDEAITALQEVIRLQPDLVKAYNDLGIVLSMKGAWHESRESFLHALRLKPDYAEAHHNLGIVLGKLARPTEAIRALQDAVRFAPAFAPGFNNLGLAQLQMGQLNEALDSFRQVVRLKSDFAEAHSNIGIVMNKLRRLDEASQSFRQALAFKPDMVEALVGLASVLCEQGKLEEAVSASLGALRLKPDHAEAHSNLGQMYLEMGKTEAALEQYEVALRLKPDYGGAHWSRALLLLLLGRFNDGWLEYEWRHVLKKVSWEHIRRPLWDGSPLAGRTILIHTEQGAGDIFQMIRFAPLVKQQGGTVILACPGRLLAILKQCQGIDHLVAGEGELPPFDLHVPLMSVPGMLRTTLEAIPANIPYIFADPKLVETWRLALAQYPGRKVGIAWQGDPKFPSDRARSIPLGRFEHLSRLRGVQLLSLQKGFGSEQLAGMKAPAAIVDLGSRLDQTGGAFTDTAAVMKNLDLVITSDTSIAHLAGALGVPVWVALAYIPDWRWLLGRDDSPWYPSMRLFRQTRRGDWEDVFERMANELQGVHFPSAR